LPDRDPNFRYFGAHILKDAKAIYLICPVPWSPAHRIEPNVGQKVDTLLPVRVAWFVRIRNIVLLVAERVGRISKK